MFPFSKPQLLGQDVPPTLLLALQDLARRNHRSVAAEAHHALDAWISPPPITAQERRRTEVAGRLNVLLQHVNTSAKKSFIPSQVAQAIGAASAEKVVGWFAGEVEPTLQELAAVADFLAGSEEWLQHGNGGMFVTEYARLSEDPATAVTWLLEARAHESVSHIRFVRNRDHGSLALVKQFGGWRCQIFHTPYVVSEDVGTGGESALAHLSVMWELLYQHYSTSKDDVIIKSYLLENDDFQSLIRGAVHPLAVLTAKTVAPWWEDIWEVPVTRRLGNYWDGWAELCERIQRVVSSHHSLAHQVPLIRARTHPFLQ